MSAETGKTLDFSSWVLINDIPPQTLKTQATEILESTSALAKNILLVLTVFGVIFSLIGANSSMSF